MSDKPRFPADEAKAVAAEIMRWLDPACERLVIAGSLRREKPIVGDVEILYNPKTEVRANPEDMFNALTINLPMNLSRLWRVRVFWSGARTPLAVKPSGRSTS